MIDSSDIVACICEGNSEKYIMSMLLEEDKLIFTEDQLLENEFLQGKYRNPANFSSEYLTMDYGSNKIVVLSIQDNKKSYSLKKPYSNKVKSTYIVVTSPEIEMLMIHSLNLYNEYQKVKTKESPSLFLSKHLKKTTSKIKSEKFIRDFYNRYSLTEAIKTYKSKSQKHHKSIALASLLKDC